MVAACKELYHGYRAKFLMIVYWIAATYVLADVYSAQLTSQFARPPHEAPINTLQRLQTAMLRDGYQLFVEKESSSLEMLEVGCNIHGIHVVLHSMERVKVMFCVNISLCCACLFIQNGTEVFRHLYALMKLQNPDMEGYLIDSVEAGILLIADGLENKAVLGGRETLYFNIQQFGERNGKYYVINSLFSSIFIKDPRHFNSAINFIRVTLRLQFRSVALSWIVLMMCEFQMLMAFHISASFSNSTQPT